MYDPKGTGCLVEAVYEIKDVAAKGAACVCKSYYNIVRIVNSLKTNSYKVKRL